jgi:hypothetical protein
LNFIYKVKFLIFLFHCFNVLFMCLFHCLFMCLFLLEVWNILLFVEYVCYVYTLYVNHSTFLLFVVGRIYVALWNYLTLHSIFTSCIFIFSYGEERKAMWVILTL